MPPSDNPPALSCCKASPGHHQATSFGLNIAISPYSTTNSPTSSPVRGPKLKMSSPGTARAPLTPQALLPHSKSDDSLVEDDLVPDQSSPETSRLADDIGSLTSMDIRSDPILSSLARRQAQTPTNPPTAFKAKPAPSTLRQEGVGPRMTKAAALRLGLQWEGNTVGSGKISKTVSSGEEGPAGRERKEVDFANVPGHKREGLGIVSPSHVRLNQASSFIQAVASLSTPFIAPRETKASKLRTGGAVTTPGEKRDMGAAAVAAKAREREENMRKRASIALPASLAAPQIVSSNHVIGHVELILNRTGTSSQPIISATHRWTYVPAYQYQPPEPSSQSHGVRYECPRGGRRGAEGESAVRGEGESESERGGSQEPRSAEHRMCFCASVERKLIYADATGKQIFHAPCAWGSHPHHCFSNHPIHSSLPTIHFERWCAVIRLHPGFKGRSAGYIVRSRRTETDQGESTARRSWSRQGAPQMRNELSGGGRNGRREKGRPGAYHETSTTTKRITITHDCCVLSTLRPIPSFLFIFCFMLFINGYATILTITVCVSLQPQLITCINLVESSHHSSELISQPAAQRTSSSP